jgi:glycerol-3-phosphate O-acyltransferase/dihydroxyacetone phosphate acyltransferase
LALLDPTGAETLRQNREKLSSNITELINEYGPKVFTDFDATYISRQPQSPIPSRTTSSTSMSWASAPSKLPKIASGFFQQATRMNWLDDKNIFNWGRAEDSEMTDDVFFFLDRFYGGRSRSGSVSESDSRSMSRNRSRASSISSMDGFKLEGMTSLPAVEEGAVVTSDNNKAKTRRIFRIDDVDEDDDELSHLAVAQGHPETKKDV